MSALIRGLRGHPSHPPLTDATIGMFVLAAGLSVLGKAGVAEGKLGPAAWLALVGGLAVAAPTAVTGFADWIQIEWGSALWRTATIHLSGRDVREELFEVDLLDLERLGAGKGEQLPRQVGAALRRAAHTVEHSPDLVGIVDMAERELACAEDCGQEVVEVVREAAGQLAERLHLLRAE